MTSKKYILNKLFLICGLALVMLIFMLTTNPDSIPLALLIIPFGLLWLIVFQITKLILRIFMVDQSIEKLVATSVASFAVLLLLLQSLDQLTWKDALLTVVFAVLFWLYVWRADFLHR